MGGTKLLENLLAHYNLKTNLVEHLWAKKGFNVEWNKILVISCLPLSCCFTLFQFCIVYACLLALFQFCFVCTCQKCLSTLLCESFRVCNGLCCELIIEQGGQNGFERVGMFE